MPDERTRECRTVRHINNAKSDEMVGFEVPRGASESSDLGELSRVIALTVSA